MTDKEKKQVRKYLLQSYAKKFKRRLFKRIDNGEKSYYYKRICVTFVGDKVEVYDTSSDIYRPLSLSELVLLTELGEVELNKKLVEESYTEKIRNTRNLMHIAIAKKNSKEKEYYYKIAMNEIKNYKEYLEINN